MLYIELLIHCTWRCTSIKQRTSLDIWIIYTYVLKKKIKIVRRNQARSIDFLCVGVWGELES